MISKPIGKSFLFDEIRTAVKKYHPKIVALVQGEATAGVWQPLDGVGELCEM